MPISRCRGCPLRCRSRLQPQLNALGVAGNVGFYDLRAGRWGGLVTSVPLVPGPGVGNNLNWAALGVAPPANDAAYKAAVWQAFQDLSQRHGAILGVNPAELGPSIGSYEKGRLVHVSATRVVNGVTVRNSLVKGTLNSGNLVLYGAHNWGAIDVATTPALTARAGAGRGDCPPGRVSPSPAGASRSW